MAEKFNIQEAFAALTASMAAMSANINKNNEDTKTAMQKLSEETKTNMNKVREEGKQQNKDRHEESKQIYEAIKEKAKQTTKLIEATEQRITDNMEVIRQHVDLSIESNAEKITEFETKIQQLGDQVSAYDTKMGDMSAQYRHKIKELEQRLDKLQLTPSAANQTTFVYRSFDDINAQVKFYGKENENPMQFIRTCERDMDVISDHFSESEKINWIVRRLKSNAAEWFSIVHDKINTYEELITHFKNRYWNNEIQRKVRVQLEFGKYATIKGSKETYVIQLVSKAKFLEPEIAESDLMDKIAHHFGRSLQIAVLTQGIKTVEEMLLLLSKWDNVDIGINANQHTHNTIQINKQQNTTQVQGTRPSKSQFKTTTFQNKTNFKPSGNKVSVIEYESESMSGQSKNE